MFISRRWKNRNNKSKAVKGSRPIAAAESLQVFLSRSFEALEPRLSSLDVHRHQ